ncbi:MAG: DUF4145 domain-containing protein [Gammaproteobacteria bacterium]|nr:DUF4145 domain-containing protein [Gammaproteobacteria bacterium]MBU1602773.1 DUF4145 domain-containing protein [Gammaproteobacteria bacterium]MBU2432445.1 DUF4145 domain-containing protein [Gammaproteobacteria bacterium]MBU2449105.1 DUF4145 domain-containing protein [Gammaproteobacteria bacterium]
MTYIPPQFNGKSFTCPHCDVYAQFWWFETKKQVRAPGGGSMYKGTDLHIANCHHCSGRMVWFVDDSQAHVLYPSSISAAPLPHVEIPENVKRDYLEAKDIVNASPRGAAALLRLALQKLCVHLGGGGANLNDDIGLLVQSGLPVQIQQALDVVRVIGNNAVHPGEISVDDNPEIAQALFGLINVIVENRIAEPKRIEALYASLPEGARNAIERRDG